MAGRNGITIDELFGNLPKMMSMADDMHRMTNYLGDLRLITIIATITGYLGGICFLIFKCYMWRHKQAQNKRRYHAASPGYMNGELMQNGRLYSPRGLPLPYDDEQHHQAQQDHLYTIQMRKEQEARRTSLVNGTLPQYAASNPLDSTMPFKEKEPPV